MRRFVDVTIALTALILLSPLLAVVMLAVFISSPGNPFYGGWRAGQDGRNLAKLHPDFAASLAFGLSHIDDIAVAYAPKLGLPPDAIKVYLTQNVDYSLDEENRKGLRLFYKLAHEAGITPGERDLYFA